MCVYEQTIKIYESGFGGEFIYIKYMYTYSNQKRDGDTIRECKNAYKLYFLYFFYLTLYIVPKNKGLLRAYKAEDK